MRRIKNPILEAIGTVLLIIVGLITIGLLFKFVEEIIDFSDTQKKKSKPKPTKLQLKLKRLKFVQLRIEELQPTRQLLRQRESKYFRFGRYGVGFLFIGINLFLIWLNNWSWELGFIVNINSAIVLLYTFLGFVFYGNVSTLSRTIHVSVSRIARKKYIHFLTELEEFERELPILIEEIKVLESKENIPSPAIDKGSKEEK